MKVLILSLDDSALNEKSDFSLRLLDMSNLVERIDVIVPSRVKSSVCVKENCFIYGLKRKTSVYFLFSLVRKINNLFKKEKYSVITSQDPFYLGFVAYLFSKKFKSGLEVQFHGSEEMNFIKEAIARFVFRKADSIRVASERLKREVIEKYGVSEKNIFKVPIHTEHPFNIFKEKVPETEDKGAPFISDVERAKWKSTLLHFQAEELTQGLIPRSSAAAQSPELALGLIPFVFMTAGRLVKIKNIKLQIQALKIVAEKINSNFEFWILGSGPEKETLEKEAKKQGLLDKVKFFGFVDNIEDYYKKANAFVLSSDKEGWSRVIIEAAFHELPIIMTNVGCAGEVIKNNESGIIVPVGEINSLADAMGKIISNPNLASNLGINARLAVLKLPSKEEIYKMYFKSWENAVRA